MLIKNMHVADRPRERLQKLGSSRLSDTELLALLLNTGSRKKGVMETASSILKNTPLDALKTTKISDLASVSGVSVSKACAIVAAIELGKRIFQDTETLVVTSPKIIFDKLKEFSDSKKENLIGLYLNVKNVLLVTEIISVGTVNESLIHPREIFEPAIRCVASGFVLAHNHPSNDPSPSQEDIDCTMNIKHLSKMMGIKLHDHVILAKKGYYSFKEEGLL